jgi:pimeloyl-ACP methyl ester carboxylesterase
MKSVLAGHANVNGITLYHEVHGSGEPLVVIPGGLMTIGEMAPLIEPLSKSRKVIGVELQGHGRTADTDRPLAFSTMADDIGALLDHLDIDRADVLGYSLGGAIALRTAIQHPDKVRRLVVISNPYARSGWYPEAQKGMASVSAAMADNMMHTPTGKASKDWPDPERLPMFLDRFGKMMGTDYDWTDDVRTLSMPVQLIYADNDSISQTHVAEFFALLGGGVREPGWRNTQLSRARLAVIPGYSHYNFFTSAEIPPTVEKFLGDPLARPPAGGSPASQSAP